MSHARAIAIDGSGFDVFASGIASRHASPRCDLCSAVLGMLKGERVVALTATEAKLSGGLRYYRKGRSRLYIGAD